MQLIVLGMHRSGTSSITRLLNMAGAYFGPEGILNALDEGNPKGYWERRDVRAACDGLLQDAGYDWWKVAELSLEAIPEEVREQRVRELQRIVLELDAHRPWVVKEPRLSLLFPLLRPTLEVPVCIHVTREPLEVADSLESHHGLPVPAGLALWELYTVHAFRGSAGLPRLHVRYEDLMRTPVATTGRLVEQLAEMGVEPLRSPTEKEVTAFITPGLHRQHRSPDQRPLLMNASQIALAAAIDDGSILQDAALPERVSDGALAALRLFEDYRARQRRIDELTEAVTALRDDVSGRDTTVVQLRAELTTGNARIAELQADSERRRRITEDALAGVQRRVTALQRSRSWRAAESAYKMRRRLTPGVSNRRTGALDLVIGEITRARDRLEQGDNGDPEPPAATYHVPRARPSTVRRSGPRPKIAVLAWDVGHNPLGRAHTLAGILQQRYDVEIWGAQFERYSTTVWPPLRDADIPIHAFPGETLPRHLTAMRKIAGEIEADAIYVSKPRFPSLGLGILAKEARNRPLVLDVDDDELAFFRERNGMEPFDLLDHDRDPNLQLPFERLWTRASQPLIDEADGLTVSNVALQERHGGVIVPHARDAALFDPTNVDRDQVRRHLGVAEDTRLLLFGGTPRVHKGVIDVLRALDGLGDERYRLMLFGTRELKDLRRELRDLDRWLITLPYHSFDDLPALVGVSDLACVLPDPDHPVTPSQFPAKIVDALAMRVPCLVRPTPPLRPLLDLDVVHTWDAEDLLEDRIARIFDDYDEARDRAALGRKVFEDGYSYDAVSEVVGPLFDRLLDQPPRLTARLASLTEASRRLFGADHERIKVAPRVARRPRRPAGPTEQYDIVMFWKQNDTGIYGRRPDMFVKYLERSGRVGSIVHFDSPITPERLYADFRRSRGTADQAGLVVRQTMRRLLRRCDTERTRHHTFLYGGGITRRMGLPRRARYVDYVTTTLRRHGFGQRPTILWGYPVNDELPRLIDALSPDLVVTDVVDDHRTFPDVSAARKADYERNYREVLARSDLVFANCEPVADAVAQFGVQAQIVPNGLELRNGDRAAKPAEFRGLRGPIIGYVGNLSHRLDVGLLETLVDARPSWQFVFVGSAHLDKSVLRLDSRPNTHFVGTKPYDQALAFLDHFDVALIPHLDNDMTQSMNPLKAFVYCSAGIPVVSTPVPNLDGLERMITIAEGPDEFLTAIESALRTDRATPDPDALRPYSWNIRVEQVLAVVDEAFMLGGPDISAQPPSDAQEVEHRQLIRGRAR